MMVSTKCQNYVDLFSEFFWGKSAFDDLFSLRKSFPD